MKHLTLLSVLVLFAGCSGKEVNSSILVSEPVTISEEHFDAQALPRYIEDGTQYEVPAVGFEASDGSFFPVLALCNPVPRGGSVEPIRLSNRRLRVFRGSDPIAANNVLLGVYEIASAESELQIGFSISRDGRLRLSAKDPESGKNLAIRHLPPLMAASDSAYGRHTSQELALASRAIRRSGSGNVPDDEPTPASP